MRNGPDSPVGMVAFLWFMTVIRRRLGQREDLLFATELLGSGLAFAILATTAAVCALEPGLEHLAHRRRQQTAVAGQLDALGTGSLKELAGPLAHRRLVSHQRHDTRRTRPLDHAGAGCRTSAASWSVSDLTTRVPYT